MSIDITHERPIPFSAVGQLPWVRDLYAQFDGYGPTSRRPHIATIHRWASRGIRGVRLEFVQVGGTRVTTEAALQRFFEALTTGRVARPTPPSEDRPDQPGQDKRESDISQETLQGDPEATA